MIKRLLVVEDVEEVAQMLKIAFESQSVPEVRISLSSAEARIEISRRRPDFVLLDEVLPGESALDFLKELQTLKIPTLLMTGAKDYVGAPLPEGAIGRVLKPDWADLDGFIQSIIEKHLI